MNRERESLKRQLDAELEEIRLSTEHRNHVIGQIRPKGWRARLKAMWNTEIEIPLLPAGAAFALLLAAVVILKVQHSQPDMPSIAEQSGKQLIKVDGNSYWKDEYDKAVAMNENQN